MNRESYLWDGTGEPDEDVEQLESLLGAFRSTGEMPGDAYLWDGTGEPDADVVWLEQQLGAFRSNAPVPDLPLPVPARPERHSAILAFRPKTLAVRFLPLAAAAAIAAIAIAGTGVWVASNEPDTHISKSGEAPPVPTENPTEAPVEPSHTTDPAPESSPTVTIAPEITRRPARVPQHQVAHGASPAEVAPTVLPVPDGAPSTATRRVSNAIDSTTALHLEQAQILLRSFRNTAPDDVDGLAYESRRSRELLTRNILLRRSAVSHRDVPAYSVLSDIEPYLLDIANLDARAPRRDVEDIQERVERSAIVAGVQLYARSGPAAPPPRFSP